MQWWGPALMFAAAVFAALAPSSSSGSPGYEPPLPSPGGPMRFEELLERAGLGEDTRVFLRAVARRESGFNPSARNDSTGEVAAGRRALDGNGNKGALARGYFQGNPHLEDFRAFGSGGLFGLLGVSGLVAGGKDGPFRLVSPFELLDPDVALVCYLDFLNRLMRYQSFKGNPTWGTLRLGGASLGTMGNPEGTRAQQTLERFRTDLAATGGPAGFEDRPVTDWNYPGPAAMLARLRGNA